MRIIRGRAPLRLGLAGGGTDVSPYAEEFGGRILSAAIDRYAYAYVHQISSGVSFHSPDREMKAAADIADIEGLRDDFALHVAAYLRVMKEFNNGECVPLHLATQVDAPPGSGLGSSSTLVVAMVGALCEFLRVSPTPYEVARLAWEIERVDCGLAGGWQDQYAAAFGGFNFMESAPGDAQKVVVNPLRIRPETQRELEASLLLYYGGVSRASADVIVEQQARVQERDTSALEATHRLRDEAVAMKDHLLVGDIGGFAQSLQSGWDAKKKIATRVTNPVIDKAYQVAMEHGMIAGKVSGAGGGGFMMLVVDPERRLEVQRHLELECGGIVSACHFTDQGVEVWRTDEGRTS